MSKVLTPKDMEKIYMLSTRGMMNSEIVEVLGWNRETVRRVLGIAKAVRDDDEEELQKAGYAYSSKIVEWAQHKFGKKEKPRDIAPPDNTADSIEKILYMLKQNNELLRGLCAAWGVEEKEAEK